MATDTDTKYLRKVRMALRTLRGGVEGEASAQLLHTFIVAAENEGKTVTELAQLVGASKTTVSRQLLDLSDTLRSGAPGYKLLDRIRDPHDLRLVIFKVSHKGRNILNQLKDIMEE